MIYLRQFLYFFTLFIFTSLSAQTANKLMYSNSNDDGYLDLALTPPSATDITTSTVVTNAEGITHIQNVLGQLKFYVKSDGIYNPDGTLMTGSSTLGDAKITEVNVCQIPGSPNQYYVFYTQNTGCSNLYYSKVDASGPGLVFNANVLLGDTANSGAEYAEGKEIIEIPNSTEKWLVLYRCGFGFERYKIRQTSIDGPTGVRAWIPPSTPNPTFEGKGELDYHNENIVYASTESDLIYSFKFNPCEGKFAGNAKTFNFDHPYGVEFSPSCNFIFASSLNAATTLPGNANLGRILNTTGGAIEYIKLENANNCSSGVQADVALGQLELGSNLKIYTPGVGTCTVFELDNLEGPVVTTNNLDMASAMNRGLSDIVQSSAFNSFLTLNVTKTDVKCNGGQGGSITLDIQGGIPPYNVKWYDGSGLLTKNNLAAGNYSVEITDESCGKPTLFRSIYIDQPDTISIKIETNDAKCFYGEGKLEYDIDGGTQPYTEVWPVGYDHTAPVAGTYDLLVIDANGCHGTQQFTIESPDRVVWEDTVIHAVCHGDFGQVIYSNIKGGVPPYVINGSPDTIINLTAGYHKLTIQDRNGCTTEKFYLVEEPDEILIDIKLEQEDCNLFEAVGTAEAIGGSGDLTIEWLGINNNKIPPGKYAVRATDTNGCEGFQTFEFVPDDTQIKIPNIFSPNGDGNNEYFTPNIYCYREIKYNIYSRWGEHVFESTPDNLKWFGFDQSGNLLPNDVYVCIIEYIDSRGLEQHLESSVLLSY